MITIRGHILDVMKAAAFGQGIKWSLSTLFPRHFVGVAFVRQVASAAGRTRHKGQRGAYSCAGRSVCCPNLNGLYTRLFGK
jgi:hypothetical protein